MTLPKGLSRAEWSGIQEEYQRRRHAAFPLEGGGYRARNWQQQWVTRFDARGFEVVPDQGGWRWGLELQQAYLKASNTRSFAGFGGSVAMDGDTVVVGDEGENSDATGVNGDQSNTSAAQAGAAYVFVRDGTTWSQQAYLKPINTQGGERFGHSVSISGDSIVVGAFWEGQLKQGVNPDPTPVTPHGAPFSGAAYTYVRVGTVAFAQTASRV